MTELMPAEGVFSLIWLLIALPLAGAAILLFGGRRTNSWGPILGVLTVSASAVLGWIMLLAMLQNSAEERTFDQNLFTWVLAGSFQADMAFQLDQLSMVFVLLITTVGALIHVYSLGYMSHDRDKRKFFGYLNLFVGAMLILVLANNYLLLYVGWEGVGLASYLLIGFWQYKPSAAAAAKKAFIINRVGDVGLSLAIMLMFVTFGTVSFEGVFGVADQASEGTLNAIGLLLLLAACGKSAQFPLQAWLLDAMEGPTPVSALIHAATMVTAGVYLIARSNAIFDIAEIAATAVGLGPIGYVFAIFHLLTHGVFKAGLFLGAGSVMHGMNDNVNMRRYGAIRTVMFITFITFAAGWLAILGIPPFSGFWSKDELIHAAFEQSMITGWLLIIAAGITGFYMTRMFIMTFLGKARWEDDVHPHESPKVMTIPLIILALGSVFMGMALLFWGNIESWLEPVVGFEKGESPLPTWATIALSLLAVGIGVLVAYLMYQRRPVPVDAPHGSWLTRAAREELYGNQVNDVLVVQPTYYASRWLVWFDNKAVDGFVNGSAAFVGGLSGRLRRYQTGFARSYALSMVGGAVLVVLALVLVRAS